MNSPTDLPLSGVYVLDFVPGALGAIGRTLAELGAEVARVEPPGGMQDRPAPGDEAAEIEFNAINAGKRSIVIDIHTDVGRAKLEGLIERSQIVLLDASPWAVLPVNTEELRQKYPSLVVMNVSDFGTEHAISHWKATDPVLHALSSELARSGLAGREPLIPPGRIALGTASSQGAYAALLAYFNSLNTGEGDLLDFSALDGTSHALDPGYGVGGSAAAGTRPSELPRDRPPKGVFYPILKCADGYVRICVLSPRQWQSMFAWMGSPEEFADPKYNKLQERFTSPTLNPAIARFFSEKTRAQLEREGELAGVPVGALLSLEETLETGHIVAREAITTVSAPSGNVYAVPNGIMEVDGRRMGPRAGAPALGEYSGTVGGARQPARQNATQQTRPLEGIKILDMGVIVVGADQGRLLADQGADVIKVEAKAFPDGGRQSLTGDIMSIGFAVGHRNKRSLGLNLRDPKGKEIFLKLAAEADIILSNFKPGTLNKLGLGYNDISAINPGIIMVDSSAFGPTGPWSGRMGYGPLVRANAGLTDKWRYADDPESFSDSVTIYPDHTAARYGVIGALSLLVRRARTGRGGTVSIAQSEIMLGHMAIDIGKLKVGIPDGAPDAPWGIYRCKGDDEWVAITVRNTSEWSSLCLAIGRDDLAADTALADRAGRKRNAKWIEAAVIDWLEGIGPREAMEILQEAGVPAGMLMRVGELPEWPYYVERDFFRTEKHPLINDVFLAENAPIRSQRLLNPPSRPAPLVGEQTGEVIAEWLGMGDDDIERLIAAEILEAETEKVAAE